MIIKCYTNNSEKNALTKSITELGELTGNVRNDTDVLNPVLTLAVTDTYTLTEILMKTNYMYIQDFGRYYFAGTETLKTLGNNLFEITLHVDVLSTWKSDILANRAIVRRNAHKFNTYIDDGDYRVYQNPIIKTMFFQNGFEPNNSSYVLAVAGNN